VPVLAIKTEQRCKLCRHDQRPAIDALLEARSLRKKDEQGRPINLAYVLERFREMGVENPNEDNIKAHWKKHCEQVSEAKLAEAESIRDEIIAKLDAGELDLADIDESLKVLFTIGYHEALERYRRGEKTGITLDHLDKWANTLQRRRVNENVSNLIGALAGGVARAVSGGSVQGELPPAPVEDEIEGELVDDDG